MKKASHLTAFVALVCLCGFHLRFIDVPWPHADEAVYANYNATRSFALWDNLYDAPQRPLIDSIFTFQLVPWQMSVFAIPQRFWGIGPWQQRVIPMLFSLLSLFLLWHILNSLCPAPIAFFVTAYFALTYLFFRSAHIARPEPLIFFVFLANLWWLVSESDRRYCAAVAGVAFALCFNLHPNVIIPLFGMMLLIISWERFQWRAVISKPRYAWWAIGFFAAMLWYLAHIDVESAVMKLGWAKGVTYTAFPICRFKWNLAALLQNMTQMIRGGSAFHNLLGISIGFSFVSLRNYAHLSRRQQFVAVITVGLLLSYACFVASTTMFYALYIYPWVILCAANFVVDFAQTPMCLNPTDLLIVATTGLFFMDFAMGAWLDVWLIYPLAWLLVDSIRHQRARWKMAGAVIVIWVLLPRWIPNLFMIKEFLRHVLIYRPVATLVLVIGPPLIVGAIRARWKNVRLQEGILVSYVVVLLSVNITSEFRLCLQSFRQQQITAGLETALGELRQGKKMVGPTQLWLYSPSAQLRSDYVLFVRNRLGGNPYGYLALARHFGPEALLLLRPDSLKQLMREVRASQEWTVLPEAKEHIQLFGDVYQLVVLKKKEVS